ncbi:unnamed protein product [Trifolium pratense]|uniref:Uncharacterized protein n=1 Tax=Trifolium pratense TaxID=57577 RepID=A0ACB0L234_TRIPR|nr:unnamed protein product [Trifolium pratense]
MLTGILDEETKVKDVVLKLSFEDLPSRLKPCFLYLGIFPEDSEINVRRLLQLWVAEGFIQETGSRDAYDIAEDYLYELIDRSLIQVARVEDIEGVQTCRIHDLLRDLFILESKEDKIFEVCTETNILIPSKPRRLSVHSTMSQYISSSTKDHSCVRSLFFSNRDYFVASDKWKLVTKDIKLVRVLDFECGLKIPSNLGNFIHLRYLRIGSQYLHYVPDFICNLQNLQTLHFEPTRGECFNIPISFPYAISKLKHLTHVHTDRYIMLRSSSSKSDSEVVMWHLQTIGFIALDKKTTYLIEKGCFPKLTTLQLMISTKFDGEVPKMLLSLKQLKHLNKLEICTDDEQLMMNNCKFEEVLQSLKHFRHLSILKIVYPPDLVTRVAVFPPNITKLTLAGIIRLNDDGMKVIGSLTKLQIFIISYSTVKVRIHVSIIILFKMDSHSCKSFGS